MYPTDTPKDLISKLLVVDPAQRITVQEALTHDFFQILVSYFLPHVQRPLLPLVCQAPCCCCCHCLPLIIHSLSGLSSSISSSSKMEAHTCSTLTHEYCLSDFVSCESSVCVFPSKLLVGSTVLGPWSLVFSIFSRYSNSFARQAFGSLFLYF